MGKFLPGQSGNPSGRPPGVRDRRLAFRDLIEEKAPEILQTVIDGALAGDMAACKLLLDKVVPSIRATDRRCPLPIGDDGLQPDVVMTEMARGAITPVEAERITGALLNAFRLKEFAEFEERLAKLENASAG